MPQSPIPSFARGHVPRVLIGTAGPKKEEPKVDSVPALLKPVSKPIPKVEADKVSTIDNPEADKYRKMWGMEAYRAYAPGEDVADKFLQVAAPKPGDTVIDFGAGTGRGALRLAIFGSLHVTMLDFAEGCLDPDIRDMLVSQQHVLRFVLADLEKEIPVSAKYGFCTDVMEHIPEDKVDAVVRNILKSAEHVFFQISTMEDHCGSLINETLHLTVKPYEWWVGRLKFLGATIHWSEQKKNGDVLFYVTGWSNAKELVKFGDVNTEEEQIVSNIKSCIARNLPNQLKPHMAQDVVVSLLCGGPSLSQYWDEILDKWDGGLGQKIITTNGTYNQCIERGIQPSAQIIVDAREFNKRFVEPVIPTCKYLIASQCHPSVFDAIPPEQVFVWHTPLSNSMADMVSEELKKVNPEAQWHPVPGGSTVTLRALTLLRILGFQKFEMYGFDSCLQPKWQVRRMDGKLMTLDNKAVLFDTEKDALDKCVEAADIGIKGCMPEQAFIHHAYEQKENDLERKIIKVSCGGRVFYCHPWMASQAQEFLDQMQYLLHEEIELIVHGDGLIAHILQTGANLAQE